MQRSGKAHHKDAILTEIIISLGILPNLELGRTKVIFSVSSQEIFVGMEWLVAHRGIVEMI